VTSAIQTQIDDHAALTTAHAAATNLVKTSGAQNITGAKLFSTTTPIQFRASTTKLFSPGTGTLQVDVGGVTYLLFTSNEIQVPAGRSIAMYGGRVYQQSLLVSDSTVLLTTDPNTVVIDATTASGKTISIPWVDNDERKIVNLSAHTVTIEIEEGAGTIGGAASDTLLSGKTGVWVEDGQLSGNWIREVY
jgi:hypothetical protein